MSERKNPRSWKITEGHDRAPNRAMLRAVGFDDADFGKPIVGIANSHSNITPCNARAGRARRRRGRRRCTRAGGMPQMFGTITICDGISMGTEGMKCSLVSREVIADSIETVARGQMHDGVLAIGGCDKNMPGALIAIARLDIPAIFVYGGTIKAGPLRRQRPHDRQRLRGGRRARRRQDERHRLRRRSSAARCPGNGSCGGMYTANTMSSAIEALGMSLPEQLDHGRRGRREARQRRGERRARCSSCVAQRPDPAEDHDPQGVRERDRGGHGGRRLDQRRAAPARDRARRAGAARARRLREASARRSRCSATSSRAGSTSRPTCTGSAAFRWS